jgi:alpha-ketoglutarate-dependent 2,4-dichlorophenoxyacetate dioxygenase
MSLTLLPITPTFAAEVGDLDLSLPLAPEDLEAVRSAFSTYAVLVFTAQRLTAEEHLLFASNFGPLERTVQLAMKRERLRVREELADVANMDPDGKLWQKDSRMRAFQLQGNRLWHTDSSFKAPTGFASLLYARSIPPVGGHTEFADLRAAWDALPEPMQRRVDGLVAEHSLLHSRGKLGFTDFSDDERRAFAPVARPLVRTLPESRRKTLYIASHIGRIRGLADDEATRLLTELTAHATQRQFVYTHRWRVGDLVMWDNRCTMHRGTAYDDLRWPRDMQRATTSDRIDAFGTPEVAGAAAADY